MGRGACLGLVELKRLRRAQVARESVGYLLLPCLYGALMAAHVFAFSPSLLALAFAFVAVLLLQVRSSKIAAAVGQAPAASHRGEAASAEAVEAADRRLLRQVTLASGANVAGYLAFLAGLDLHLRAAAAGAPTGGLLPLGAAAGIGIVLAGREAARRAAWRGYAQAFPGLWNAEDGLRAGKATRSPAAYFEWRSRVQAGG